MRQQENRTTPREIISWVSSTYNLEWNDVSRLLWDNGLFPEFEVHTRTIDLYEYVDKLKLYTALLEILKLLKTDAEQGIEYEFTRGDKGIITYPPNFPYIDTINNLKKPDAIPIYKPNGKPYRCYGISFDFTLRYTLFDGRKDLAITCTDTLTLDAIKYKIVNTQEEIDVLTYLIKYMEYEDVSEMVIIED